MSIQPFVCVTISPSPSITPICAEQGGAKEQHKEMGWMRGLGEAYEFLE